MESDREWCLKRAQQDDNSEMTAIVRAAFANVKGRKGVVSIGRYLTPDDKLYWSYQGLRLLYIGEDIDSSCLYQFEFKV